MDTDAATFLVAITSDSFVSASQRLHVKQSTVSTGTPAEVARGNDCRQDRGQQPDD
jgi:hypothetical protein